jgi:hypothetical protein
MRINIISSFRSHTGLTQDVNMLRGILTAVYGKDLVLKGVPHIHPHCPEADVNIFLEVINPSLFAYAGHNVWIPNLEWAYQTWEPYFGMVEVWVKTREAEDILREAGIPCKYIGWSSVDKVYAEKVNFSRAFVPVGKNIFRNPRPILQAYLKLREDPDFAKLPTLVIAYNPDHVKVVVPPAIADKVEIHGELKEAEYDDLLKSCGLCVCTSLAEGFGHAVNECMSVGQNLILSPIAPFRELAGEMAQYGEVLECMHQPDCMGTLIDVSSDSLVACLKNYVSTPFRVKRAMCENVRTRYETHHKEWIERMKGAVQFQEYVGYELAKTFPKEEDLPDVSIITLTRNRREFMPLAKYCVLLQSYPADKLEWVVVDDGEDAIEDTLMGIPNVVYVRCDPGLTIAQKRNLGMSRAMYPVFVMMDDDDVYPENSVLTRVAMLQKSPPAGCVFSTTIPCYDIVQYKSFMNVPPMTLPMSQRVSEATIACTREFWEARQFPEDVKVGEADAFIRGREHMCREVSCQDVIVSLVHPRNSSSRKAPEGEPNGCHYGFNEKLFALVSEIGVNSERQTASGGGGDESGGGAGDDHPPRGPLTPQPEPPLPPP